MMRNRVRAAAALDHRSVSSPVTSPPLEQAWGFYVFFRNR
jgi:hypothetical protein